MKSPRYQMTCIVFGLIFTASDAFANATLTCKQADDFLHNPSFRCKKNGTDCSRGACVKIASCYYIKGYEGFEISFAYPEDCKLRDDPEAAQATN